MAMYKLTACCCGALMNLRQGRMWITPAACSRRRGSRAFKHQADSDFADAATAVDICRGEQAVFLLRQVVIPVISLPLHSSCITLSYITLHSCSSGERLRGCPVGQPGPVSPGQDAQAFVCCDWQQFMLECKVRGDTDSSSALLEL